MTQDFVKMAQDAMKPALKLAENNTALTVKLLQSQSAGVAELLQGNLEHVRALVETDDLKAAAEMQQKYVEGLNQKLVTMARDNAAAVEAAVAEAGKIFEGSVAEVQAEARKAAENMEPGSGAKKKS